MPACTGCSLSKPTSCPFVRGVRHRGFRLFRAGETAQALYRLCEGEVLLYEQGKTRALRGPGSLLGFEALTGERYRHDAVCVGTTLLCTLASSRLSGWAGANPVSALALAKEATAEARRWETSEGGGEGECEVRLARFLLARPEGTAPIPKSAVASLLRMRAETLSRCVTALAEAGAIGRDLSVIDRSILVRVAG